MNTNEPAGKALHSDNEDARRQAAALLGSAKTERKAETSRANGAKGGAHPFTEETRAKLRAAQAARREREKTERAAVSGLETGDAVKKPVGRPRTRPVTESGEKRPVGRPRKQADNIASTENA